MHMRTHTHTHTHTYTHTRTHPPIHTHAHTHAYTHHHTQDYIILCLDVGPSMDIAPPSGGDTHLEMALRVANQIVQQKVRGR